MNNKAKILRGVDPGKEGGDKTIYCVIAVGETNEDIDDAVLRLACEIKERREAARKQRVVDYMRGKGGRI